MPSTSHEPDAHRKIFADFKNASRIQLLGARTVIWTRKLSLVLLIYPSWEYLLPWVDA